MNFDFFWTKIFFFKIFVNFELLILKKNYYENKYSLNYALTEVAKLIYGFIKYGILEKLGLDKDFENYFDDELKEAKIMIQKNLYANWFF